MKLKALYAIACAILSLGLAEPGQLNSRQTPENKGGSQEAILAVLSTQQEAWNRSDLVSFMKGYWNSPQVTFAGSSGITRGWETVLARYRAHYPDRQAMGHLEFSDLEIHPLGREAALVLGRWHLKRASDEMGGIFTLVFQRFPEGWRIVHDHTSADEKAR